MITALDLFSGYGGISYGLRDYIKPIAYCEIDNYARAILASKISEGELSFAPIFPDVRELQGSIGAADIIVGGFPCQDISVAGNGKGLDGERSGLFFEIVRLTQEISPSFVFLENVPAIRTRGLRQVVGAFTEIGYDCRWMCLSASSVGAPHKRERWFLLAHSNSANLRNKPNRKQGRKNSPLTRNNGSQRDVAHTNSTWELQHSWGEQECWSGPGVSGEVMADADGERLERFTKTERPWGKGRYETINTSLSGKQFWSIKPNVGRVANGTPFRVDRIKALGNGVVPIQVKTAFEKLIGIRHD